VVHEVTPGGQVYYGANDEPGDIDETALNRRLRGIVEAALAAEEAPLSRADRELLARQISDEVTGYGPLERFLKDWEKARETLGDVFEPASARNPRR